MTLAKLSTNWLDLFYLHIGLILYFDFICKFLKCLAGDPFFVFLKYIDLLEPVP